MKIIKIDPPTRIFLVSDHLKTENHLSFEVKSRFSKKESNLCLMLIGSCRFNLPDAPAPDSLQTADISG